MLFSVCVCERERGNWKDPMEYERIHKAQVSLLQKITIMCIMTDFLFFFFEWVLVFWTLDLN